MCMVRDHIIMRPLCSPRSKVLAHIMLLLIWRGKEDQSNPTPRATLESPPTLTIKCIIFIILQKSEAHHSCKYCYFRHLPVFTFGWSGETTTEWNTTNNYENHLLIVRCASVYLKPLTHQGCVLMDTVRCHRTTKHLHGISIGRPGVSIGHRGVSIKRCGVS